MRRMLRRALAAISATRLLTLASVLLAPLVLFGVPVEQRLAPTEMRPEKGSAYVSPLKRPSWPLTIAADGPGAAKKASRTRLFEDGRPLGPAHAVHRSIRRDGRGRFSHWREALYFSTSDNSDPRTNGRLYVAVRRVFLAPELLLAVLLALAIAGRRDYARWRRRLAAWWRRLAAWWRRLVAWLRRTAVPPFEDPALPSAGTGRPGSRAKALWPLVALLFSVGLVVLVLCAPVLHPDSKTYAKDINHVNAPHYPPGYPLFLRGVNAIVHNASVLLGRSPADVGFEWSLVRPAPFSNVSIYAVLVVQHALLVLAASGFAVSITRRRWLRMVTACVLCWSPPTLLAAQTILSEGLWNPLVIAAAAFGARFLAHGERPLRSLAMHFLVLCLAMLVRYPGVVFLAMLPLALVALGLSRAVRGRRIAALLLHARAAVVVGCIGLVALGVVSAAKRAVVTAYGAEPRSVVGRAGMYRLCHAYLHPFEGMSRQDLDEVVQDLERRAGDPRIRRALEIIASSDSPWVEPWNRVRAEVVEPAFPQYSREQTSAPTDRIVNEVAWLTFTSTDLRMLRSVLLRAVRFLHFGPQPSPTLRWAMDSFAGRAEREYLREGPHAGVTAARDVGKLRRAGVLFYAAKATRPWQGRLLWLGIAGLAVLAMARGRFGRRASTATGIAASAVIYAVLVAVATVYVARYSDIVIVLEACAAALLLSELAE